MCKRAPFSLYIRRLMAGIPTSAANRADMRPVTLRESWFQARAYELYNASTKRDGCYVVIKKGSVTARTSRLFRRKPRSSRRPIFSFVETGFTIPEASTNLHGATPRNYLTG